MIRSVTGAALTATLLAALSAPAMAHSSFLVQEAEIGASFRAALRVPHGCGAEATHTIRIQIPEGFYAVKPMPKAGWTLETLTGPYQHIYRNHGEEVSQGVTEIIWSGGDLASDFYDEFVFVGTFADRLEPGDMYFPAIQECANGQEAWTDIGGNGEMPAPKVRLVAGAQHAHDDHHQDAPTNAVTVGDIAISGAFTRATLPNAPVAGGFLTLTNNGSADDVLVSASSDVAKETQIHEMAMDGNVMKMRQLTDGVVLPAGESVTLKPGGFHIMFMGLKAPLVEGESVEVTLNFAKAGPVAVSLAVGSAAAAAPAEDHSGHMMK
ncbi:copper chaperone PCu(A)C [Devosia faecipullorum]|uniref:copper chaperone PCu(A)C n=1 Tax=Devosia faecipullorum TaxID=2755039 RepID=UPI00187B58A6|nr:copper chaperone PCu(A)C [Devosia faecipullorum]MBE7733384.1 copper chaperone PCu(A)C [Devosia faecipullorum]